MPSKRTTPSPRRAQILGLVLVCFSFLLFYHAGSLSSRSTKAATDASSSSDGDVSSSEDASKMSLPKGLVIEDTELFYMLPSQPAKGLLVFFHGCNHNGQNMFRLPEDRLVAQKALQRDLAVLSISSIERASACWSLRDVEKLESNQAVEKWMERVGLSTDLPRMAMGASSGGSFVFRIHKVINAKAIAAYISPGFFQSSEGQEQKLPATVYVHMPRDSRSAQFIAENEKKLEKLQVPHKVFEAKPHAFTPEVCATRMPELGEEKCKQFIQEIVLKKHPHLMEKDTMMVLQSYTDGSWEDAMKEMRLDDGSPVLPLSGAVRGIDSAPDRGELAPTARSGHSWTWAGIEEEIAVAYAVHEMTAEHADQVLDFMIQHANTETTTTTIEKEEG